MNTKDFASKAASRATSKSRGASFLSSKRNIWIITISFGLLGLGGILWLQSFKHKKPQQVFAANRIEEAKKDPGPQYEFYKTLEKGEVRMLEEEGHVVEQEHHNIAKADPIPQPVSAQSHSTPHHKTNHKAKIPAKTLVKQEVNKNHKQYTLQLGSFKKYQEADELKARLALQGQELLIETVVLADGQKWYRVKSRPVNSYQLAIKERERLSKSHVNSMITQTAVG